MLYFFKNLEVNMHRALHLPKSKMMTWAIQMVTNEHASSSELLIEQDAKIQKWEGSKKLAQML